MAKVAVIDCQVAGIAGDMLASALVDAGAGKKKVQDAIFACQDFLKGSKISDVSFNKIVTHGFSATQLHLSYKDGAHERKGTEMLRALARTCDSLGMDQRAKAFAHDSLKALVAAEAAIHGEDFNNVHLHEASSVDTLADIIGCATALSDLGLYGATVHATRVAVGGGMLKFSHGTVPNPADAVIRILQGKNFVIQGGPAKEELTTPTGAAMLATLATGSIDYYPAIVPEKTGYGAGTKKFDGFANVVRVLAGSAPSSLEKDTVCLVETNVDDASGEVIGNMVERLTEAGAKDVTVISGTTKKSRPTFLVRVVCDNSLLDAILATLFGESGTLGARVQQVERFMLPRAMVTVPVTVSGSTFNVHVKIARDASGNMASAKPEFEDIKIIAARCNMPARRVAELVGAQVALKTGET
ncbi:MAG: nickel pincer cofactor biosynthesis protein LarC [Nitrososphaera sp.]|uniref:nickel pincer cofactor biosynthesis protein LarC n=1 Tax=Nitrososphaera sp. TaxID=1971748 RepID=UPI003D6FE957